MALKAKFFKIPHVLWVVGSIALVIGYNVWIMNTPALARFYGILLVAVLLLIAVLFLRQSRSMTSFRRYRSTLPLLPVVILIVIGLVKMMEALAS